MPWVLPNLFHNNNVTTQIQNHYNYKNKKKKKRENNLQEKENPKHPRLHDEQL